MKVILEPGKKNGRKASGIQRENMVLITQLFLSLQSRPNADMRKFFQFENQREPPSVADQRCGGMKIASTLPTLQVAVV